MESPTPWHVGGIGGCRPKLVYDASGRTILRSWGNGSDEENEANVQLAAQAPKLREQVHILREALIDSLQAWEGEEDSVKEEHAELIEETRAAIKATEETT